MAAGIAMMAMTIMRSMRVKPDAGKWFFMGASPLCAPAAQAGIKAKASH